MDQDQSASQGASNSTKGIGGKQNLSGLSDLMSGGGLFACLLKQKYMSLPIEKDKGEKGSPEGSDAGSTVGKVEIKKEIPDIRIGKVFLPLKETKSEEGANGKIEEITIAGQVHGDKDIKHDSEILLPLEESVKTDVKTAGKAAGKTDRKAPFVETGKAQFLNLSAEINKGSTLNQQLEVQEKGGTAGESQSVADTENKYSVKKGISRFNTVEKSQSGDTKLSEGEAINDLGILTTTGLKSDKPVRNNVPEGMKILPSDDAGKDHKNNGNLDISKGIAVKELNVNKGSSNANVKEHEALSSKSDVQQSEGAKEDANTTSQVRIEREKTQIYKNISTDVAKPERSVDRVVSDAPNKKIDTSQLTTQVDFSGVKGIWNGAETSTKPDIITPINFQDIANQIIDNASNMMKKDSGRIVITLEPPNLGTLNMDVRVQHDTVKMLLVADNYEVKQVLNSNLDQLKTALQGQGLNIDRLDVLVHDRSYNGNQGFQPGGGALFNDGRGGRNNAKEDTPSLQKMPSGGNELNEPHLGIISLFV